MRHNWSLQRVFEAPSERQGQQQDDVPVGTMHPMETTTGASIGSKADPGFISDKISGFIDSPSGGGGGGDRPRIPEEGVDATQGGGVQSNNGGAAGSAGVS